MTNFEAIKQMDNPIELAFLLNCNSGCPTCIYKNYEACHYLDKKETKHTCLAGHTLWLMQDYNEDSKKIIRSAIKNYYTNLMNEITTNRNILVEQANKEEDKEINERLHEAITSLELMRDSIEKEKEKRIIDYD